MHKTLLVFKIGMMAKELKEWAFILDKMDFISRHMMTYNMTLTPVENSMAIYF